MKIKAILAAIAGLFVLTQKASSTEGRALRHDTHGLDDLDGLAQGPTPAPVLFDPSISGNNPVSTNKIEKRFARLLKHFENNPKQSAEVLKATIDILNQLVLNVVQDLHDHTHGRALLSVEQQAEKLYQLRSLGRLLVECKILLVTVLDSTGSQKEKEAWEADKQLTKDIIDKINVSPTGSAAGVLAFSNYITVVSVSRDPTDLKNKVSGLAFHGGGTFLAGSLEWVLSQLKNGNIKPTADVPFRLQINSDFVLNDADKSRALVDQILAYDNVKILLIGFESATDGLNKAWIETVSKQHPVKVEYLTYPSPASAVADELNIVDRLCQKDSVPTSSPVKPPVFATANPTASPTIFTNSTNSTTTDTNDVPPFGWPPSYRFTTVEGEEEEVTAEEAAKLVKEGKAVYVEGYPKEDVGDVEAGAATTTRETQITRDAALEPLAYDSEGNLIIGRTTTAKDQPLRKFEVPITSGGLLQHNEEDSRFARIDGAGETTERTIQPPKPKPQPQMVKIRRIHRKHMVNILPWAILVGVGGLVREAGFGYKHKQYGMLGEISNEDVMNGLRFMKEKAIQANEYLRGNTESGNTAHSRDTDSPVETSPGSSGEQQEVVRIEETSPNPVFLRERGPGHGTTDDA